MPLEATIQRYRDAAIALLPPGRAFGKSVIADLAKLFEACAVEWARVHEDAEQLYQNIAPGSSAEYLDDWEEALGLPYDYVASPPTSDGARIAAVKAAIGGFPDHSQAAYQSVAASLGYSTVAFTKYPAMTCAGPCTGAIYGDEWANVVKIDITGAPSEQLEKTFTDQMLRSHGFLIINFV